MPPSCSKKSLPDGCLRAVHVYFPDPLWKARHRKRRVMNEYFVAEIQRVQMTKAASSHFWTDVQEYYQTTLEILASHTRLAGPFAVVEQAAEHDSGLSNALRAADAHQRITGVPIRKGFRKP